MAGSDRDPSHRGVHPGQCGLSIPGLEEAKGVHADSESRSVHERADDPFHNRPETLADQRLVGGHDAASCPQVLNGPEIPE